MKTLFALAFLGLSILIATLSISNEAQAQNETLPSDIERLIAQEEAKIAEAQAELAIAKKFFSVLEKDKSETRPLRAAYTLSGGALVAMGASVRINAHKSPLVFGNLKQSTLRIGNILLVMGVLTVVGERTATNHIFGFDEAAYQDALRQVRLAQKRLDKDLEFLAKLTEVQKAMEDIK